MDSSTSASASMGVLLVVLELKYQTLVDNGEIITFVALFSNITYHIF